MSEMNMLEARARIEAILRGQVLGLRELHKAVAQADPRVDRKCLKYILGANPQLFACERKPRESQEAARWFFRDMTAAARLVLGPAGLAAGQVAGGGPAAGPAGAGPADGMEASIAGSADVVVRLIEAVRGAGLRRVVPCSPPDPFGGPSADVAIRSGCARLGVPADAPAAIAPAAAATTTAAAEGAAAG
jgi:hypothetical protein